MARMIPELDDVALSQIPSNAERLIYKSFKNNIDDEMLVLHSLELIAHPTGAPPIDSETDFVIFDPRHGFLVIEVKGGGIIFDGIERRWWSTDRLGIQHEIKDPFRQARNAKYEILRNLKNSKEWGPLGMHRILAGHAVVFPDLLDVEPLIGPDRSLDIIGGNSVLTAAASWLKNVFNFWSQENKTWQPLGRKGLQVVESVFCKRVTVRVPLCLSIAREKQRQIELTERQGRILRSIQHRHRASIAGGAGTGKTLLALQRAKSLAAQGLGTLLVCFNRALADFLKRQTVSIPNLHAMSFHQLCDWRIKAVSASTGHQLLHEARSSYPRHSFFNVQMPYALARATELDKFRYQAIIVDEGQDFGDDFWLPIELLLENEEDSPLFIFFDPNQAVYKNASTFPISDTPFLLTENCRNTRHIHTIAYQYYTGDEVEPPEINGAPTQVIEAKGLDNQALQLKRIVSELIVKERIRPHDIAILVLSNDKDSCYHALQRAGNPNGAIWSFEALWKPSTVLVDTARRFKGLEASIVLLWGIDQTNIDRDKELLYVALSRARSRLYLVGSCEAIQSIMMNNLS